MCPFCNARPLVARRDARTCGDAECSRRYGLERRRTWHRAHRTSPAPRPCRGCLETFTPGEGEYRRRMCNTCRAIGPSAAVVALRRTVELYVCSGCGSTFERRPTKGQRPRWCSACADGRGWKKANPGSRRRSDHLRRSRLREVERETFDPVEIYERDGWRCQVPGCRHQGKKIRRDRPWPHPLSPSIDHIVPILEGGAHLRTNVRAAHLVCNTARGARGGSDQLLLIG